MYEPIKKLGQNFLTDRNLIEEFVDYLNIQNGDIIIEIGAGLGAVTEEIASTMAIKDFECYAVEIDSRFTSKLNEMYKSYPKLYIVEEDVLKWLPSFSCRSTLKIIGSLPFYITSPILHEIIKMETPPVSVVLLIQKEVAQKVCSPAPDSSYLSVFAQTFYDVQYHGEVSRKKFKPEPNVDGAFITMQRKNIYMDRETLRKYEGFLHRGFASPRKMLNKAFKSEELRRVGIRPDLRPEALSASEWLAFFNIMNNIQIQP